MKKFKPGTWIAIGCVVIAVLATQIYNGIPKGSITENEISVISESFPTPPPPISTPTIKQTPSPMLEKNTEILNEAAAPVNAMIEPEKNLEFHLPSSGEISRPFSDKELVNFSSIKEWRCHLGIDFLPAENDAVLAVADGVVEKIYEDHLYGTTVMIDHGDSLKSYYSSLSAVSVSEGETVDVGKELGRMGETSVAETGIHLHFSMEKNGKPIDPMGEK